MKYLSFAICVASFAIAISWIQVESIKVDFSRWELKTQETSFNCREKGVYWEGDILKCVQ